MGRSNRAVRAGPPVNDLVARAEAGDMQAWQALVERYAPLIWSICRRHQLDDADAGDVGQKVWLQLVSQLNQARDPAALPGWLATSRVVREQRSSYTGDCGEPVREHIYPREQWPPGMSICITVHSGFSGVACV
jgi:hypothetical protein